MLDREPGVLHGLRRGRGAVQKAFDWPAIAIHSELERAVDADWRPQNVRDQKVDHIRASYVEQRTWSDDLVNAIVNQKAPALRSKPARGFGNHPSITH